MTSHRSELKHVRPGNELGAPRRLRWAVLRVGGMLGESVSAGFLGCWQLNESAGAGLPVAAGLALVCAIGLLLAARRELRAHPGSSTVRMRLLTAVAGNGCVTGLVWLFCSQQQVRTTPGAAAAIVGVAFGLIAAHSLPRMLRRGPRRWLITAGPELLAVGVLTASYADELASYPRALLLCSAWGCLICVAAWGISTVVRRGSFVWVS